MDKKKILIIVGIVAVVGVGLYMWNKSNKDTQVGEEGGSEGSLDVSNASTTRIMETLPEITEPTKVVLTTRKEKKQACGRKPILKKKKIAWQQCVDAGGSISFEGDFYDSNTEYLDFEENFDNEFVFKEFDNGLNLDL